MEEEITELLQAVLVSTKASNALHSSDPKRGLDFGFLQTHSEWASAANESSERIAGLLGKMSG